MVKIVLKVASKGRLSNHGKKMVAHAMYNKGANFIAAAVLLDQRRGHRDVVFHLTCQGLEIIQKSLLMAHDYDHYNQKELMKIGHDLIKGSDELISVYGFKQLKVTERTELEAINRYYSQHLLRYVGIHDIIGGNSELVIENLMRRSLTLSKFARRVFK